MPRGSGSGAVLAGVCSRLAGLLQWNVWAVRAACLVVLLVKPVLAVIAYVLLAMALRLLDARRRIPRESAPVLASPELAERARRIEELDRRLSRMHAVGPDRKHVRPAPERGSDGSCATGSGKSAGGHRA